MVVVVVAAEAASSVVVVVEEAAAEEEEEVVVAAAAVEVEAAVTRNVVLPGLSTTLGPPKSPTAVKLDGPIIGKMTGSLPFQTSTSILNVNELCSDLTIRTDP